MCAASASVVQPKMFHCNLLLLMSSDPVLPVLRDLSQDVVSISLYFLHSNQTSRGTWQGWIRAPEQCFQLVRI